MPTFPLKTLGWLVARTPEWFLHLVAAVLGDTVFYVVRGRRRIVLSNLHHAFPERPRAWHLAIGRESCRRLVETALLSLATPFLSPDRLRTIISASPELLEAYTRHRADPAPTLICSPHLAYWEAQTSMALVVPGAFPEFGIIYRPLDNAGADDWVRRSRERFGMRLLSRREGFAEAMKILRRNGFVGVLFDQNAGNQGILATLFGRVCSTTELPGLMAQKFSARVYGIFPRRLGFWRVEIGVQRIECESSSAAVTLALNRWLEATLAANDNLCASWLWVHDRWRHQDVPATRLRLESKRNLLADDMAGRGLTELPRRTRIWIRMPNWLGDVVMAMPALRAIRTSRPDAEITLLIKPGFAGLVSGWNVADRILPLPPQGMGYFGHFRRLRHGYPDVYLLFTQSVRGDVEAWLTGSRQRFGIVRPGKSRPLLSHRFEVPAGFDEKTHHQLELWDAFLRHFGLAAPFDRSPLSSAIRTPSPVIGLIPGSENTPEKRWPVEHWRALISALPGKSFMILGTANDRPVTAAVAAGFEPGRVTDLAGKTDLPAFAARLGECAVLVTNDTGGMHLANALGIPLIALFGPTNPIRTGPVFVHPALPSGGVQILQPPGCSSSGGGTLADLRPETVAATVLAGLDPLSPT